MNSRRFNWVRSDAMNVMNFQLRSGFLMLRPMHSMLSQLTVPLVLPCGPRGMGINIMRNLGLESWSSAGAQVPSTIIATWPATSSTRSLRWAFGGWLTLYFFCKSSIHCAHCKAWDVSSCTPLKSGL